MRFRCPNCQQQVRVDDSATDVTDETQDIITCPSCNSQFNLASQDDTEIALGPGQRIDHFEIRRLLGEGTFGCVYSAWDSELERLVALKIPRGTHLRGDASRLFLREARAAAAIAHPNVVSVHEIGRHNESIYIACQYIEGITLREYMRAYPQTPVQIATILIKVLRAIHFFHEKGIIHRDIKPGNLLLDQENEPFVADFGLARKESPDEVTVTRSGHIVGTIGYMAPEQARGEIQSLSGRTDVYAVGVILYEMLTKKRPFMATTSHTVLNHILTRDPRAPRKINPKVPRDLQTICLKALEKPQEKRYENAARMADDLQRFIDGKPIHARPAGTIVVLAKLIRRNRLAATLLVIAMLATGILAYSMATANEPPPPGSVAGRISVNDPEAKIRFQQYDDFLMMPHRSGFETTGTQEETFWLKPGLYKVFAENESGARHEVWRTIPEDSTGDSANQWMPHRSWTIEEGEIVLQPFRLFNDEDVADPTAFIKGGMATIGYDDRNKFATKHEQVIEDFRIGINEVSWGRLRKAFDRLSKSPKIQENYLKTVMRRYGSDGSAADDEPARGFPVDVAIVYCELVGGRLPTNIEWEYAATQGGKTDFPSGDAAIVENVDDWRVFSTTEATGDTTPEGVRNLFNSLGEYTDSRGLSYRTLYPAVFNATYVNMQDQLPGPLPENVEVRGIPNVLLHPKFEKPISTRTRLVATPASRIPEGDAHEEFKWIGWRICR